MAKTLIAFFSRADENYFGGAMRYVKVGNTEIVCGIIKDLITADSFKIEMKEPYSPVYMTCVEEAKKDLRAQAESASGTTSLLRRPAVSIPRGIRSISSAEIRAWNMPIRSPSVTTSGSARACRSCPA